MHRRHQDSDEAVQGEAMPRHTCPGSIPILKGKLLPAGTGFLMTSVILGNDSKYGNIWEIKKEWVTQVIR